MNRFFTKSTVALLCITALTACASKFSTSTNPAVVDTNAIRNDASLTPKGKSDKLALAAEQLVTPSGFMYADAVLDSALAYDPSNKKAQFYKAYLAQLMSMKGIMKRIKPLADTDEKSKKEYARALKQIPNSGLRSFLYAGQEDIKDEKSAQAFLDGYLNGMEKFRTFLKANKDMELTLNMNDWIAIGGLDKAHRDCDAKVVASGVFKVEDCDLTHALEVRLNRADIESLQQIIAGEEIYMIAATAYSVTGTIDTVRKFDGQHNVAASVVYKTLAKYPEFATLRNGNLKRIVDMGIDAVPAVRWAMQEQKNLCPHDTDSVDNRTGYLFSNGICIKEQNPDGTKTSEILRTVEIALAGQSIPVVLGSQAQFTVQAVPAAPLLNPIQDAKVLRPTFNACNVITMISDDSMIGIFPNHEANQILQATPCNPMGY